MSWLALDIGGANLKAANGMGYAAACGFALWRHPAQLASRLRAMIFEAPQCDHLAITMTGELADCFASKSAGVLHILQAVDEASDGRQTRVYLTDGAMVSPQVARTEPLKAASSNWHALAAFCTRFTSNRPALLIDVGSTTTDLVPLVDGQVACVGHTDLERLLCGELIYTGVERSPVCAVVQTLPYHDQVCPVAQELFATMRDVYLLRKELREDPDDHDTADMQPATLVHAARRMGRVVSADRSEYSLADVKAWADAVALAQQAMLVNAGWSVIDRLKQKPTLAILSGHGEFLGRRIAAQLVPCQGSELESGPKLHQSPTRESQIGESGNKPHTSALSREKALGCTEHCLSLAEQIGASASRCAPAHALAVLAREAMEP